MRQLFEKSIEYLLVDQVLQFAAISKELIDIVLIDPNFMTILAHKSFAVILIFVIGIDEKLELLLSI